MTKWSNPSSLVCREASLIRMNTFVSSVLFIMCGSLHHRYYNDLDLRVVVQGVFTNNLKRNYVKTPWLVEVAHYHYA